MNGLDNLTAAQQSAGNASIASNVTDFLSHADSSASANSQDVASLSVACQSNLLNLVGSLASDDVVDSSASQSSLDSQVSASVSMASRSLNAQLFNANRPRQKTALNKTAVVNRVSRRPLNETMNNKQPFDNARYYDDYLAKVIAFLADL